MILGKFSTEKKAYNYSISQDVSIIFISSISCLDWTIELAGAKLVMYI
jgi:hypothetical protein